MNFVPQFLTRHLVQINYRHKDDTMSFVRIEIISKGNKKFSSEIETNNSYSINCSSGETIKFPDKICDVCISDGMMLVRTEDRDFRSGCQNVPFIKDNREKITSMLLIGKELIFGILETLSEISKWHLMESPTLHQKKLN